MGTGSSINVSNVTIRATGQYAHGIMTSGGGTITVVNSRLTGTLNRGVMLHQGFSGDTAGQLGRFSETGGSLTALHGPLFFVTNTNAIVNLSGVKTREHSGTLLDAAPSSWGTSGSNGGTVTMKATKQTLSGSCSSTASATPSSAAKAARHRVARSTARSRRRA